MKFITIIPFQLWIFAALLLVVAVAFGMPGFVVGVLVLMICGIFI